MLLLWLLNCFLFHCKVLSFCLVSSVMRVCSLGRMRDECVDGVGVCVRKRQIVHLDRVYKAHCVGELSLFCSLYSSLGVGVHCIVCCVGLWHIWSMYCVYSSQSKCYHCAVILHLPLLHPSPHATALLSPSKHLLSIWSILLIVSVCRRDIWALVSVRLCQSCFDSPRTLHFHPQCETCHDPQLWFRFKDLDFCFICVFLATDSLCEIYSNLSQFW